MAEFTRKEVISKLRKKESLAGADLSGLDLSNLKSLAFTDLSGANLEDANLQASSLEGANLSKANLRKANLSGAILIDADLSFADFSEATLFRTELRPLGEDSNGFRSGLSPQPRPSKTKFEGANFSGASLSSVELSGTEIHLATLTNAHLADAFYQGIFLTKTPIWTFQSDPQVANLLRKSGDITHPDVVRMLRGLLYQEKIETRPPGYRPKESLEEKNRISQLRKDLGLSSRQPEARPSRPYRYEKPIPRRKTFLDHVTEDRGWFLDIFLTIIRGGVIVGGILLCLFAIQAIFSDVRLIIAAGIALFLLALFFKRNDLDSFFSGIFKLIAISVGWVLIIGLIWLFVFQNRGVDFDEGEPCPRCKPAPGYYTERSLY